MKVIATIARSAGNESVGEMWHETAIFDSSNSIESVMMWARKATNRAMWKLEECTKNEVVLTIAQEPTL